MRIPLNDILEVYENIVKDINVAEVSIVIFTALDIDSLCTLKILSKFFRNDNILYKIYPTSTFTELQQKIQESKAFQKIRLFFFINCGGIIDLTKKWFARTAQIFLFQINKPIHHANIQDQNIKIVDDAFSELQKAPTSKQFQMAHHVEQDFAQEIQQRQQQRQPSQDDQQDQLIARKRRRQRSASQAIQRIQKIRKIRTQLTQKVQQYYSQQFYGLPSSYIAYKLIKDLQKLNNQYLWFAIVGTTSMYLQQKMQRQQFDTLNNQFRVDISRFNTSSQNGNNHEKNTLKKILDFQFPLLRHWSLYDSIMNSPYMISHLGLWDQFGVKKLYELFNLIGLSLDQCKQLYKYLLKTSILKLEKQMLTHAQKQKFKIFDVGFQSCIKQVDYAFQMTASDYFYALSAILERPTKKLTTEQVLNHRIQCFWQAYGLFQANHATLLSAIEQSKKNLKIATKQAFSILQRNHIINGQNLSFINILNDNQDRKIFQHPYALVKFAYLLMGINKQKKKFTTAKPFIVSLQNNLTQTSQVVGIINQVKNTFPSKFNFAIEKFNIQANSDSYLSNFMIIPKQSVGKIIRELASI